MAKSETVSVPWRRRINSLSASRPADERFEHELHLRHELPGSLQTRQVRVPRLRPPLPRLPAQLGDDVSDVVGERLRLEVKDQLTPGSRTLGTLRGTRRISQARGLAALGLRTTRLGTWHMAQDPPDPYRMHNSTMLMPVYTNCFP